MRAVVVIGVGVVVTCRRGGRGVVADVFGVLRRGRLGCRHAVRSLRRMGGGGQQPEQQGEEQDEAHLKRR
jgi:hypothetical protein